LTIAAQRPLTVIHETGKSPRTGPASTGGAGRGRESGSHRPTRPNPALITSDRRFYSGRFRPPSFHSVHCVRRSSRAVYYRPPPSPRNLSTEASDTRPMRSRPSSARPCTKGVLRGLHQRLHRLHLMGLCLARARGGHGARRQMSDVRAQQRYDRGWSPRRTIGVT
jgi:hypothetical protein